MTDNKVINCAALHVPPETSVSPSGGVSGEEARWTFPVGGMTCASCVARVEKALSRVEGVSHASVNLATNTATVTADPERTRMASLVSTIRDSGYEVPVQRTVITSYSIHYTKLYDTARSEGRFPVPAQHVSGSPRPPRGPFGSSPSRRTGAPPPRGIFRLSVPQRVITSYSIHYTKLYDTGSRSMACKGARFALRSAYFALRLWKAGVAGQGNIL